MIHIEDMLHPYAVTKTTFQVLQSIHEAKSTQVDTHENRLQKAMPRDKGYLAVDLQNAVFHQRSQVSTSLPKGVDTVTEKILEGPPLQL